MLCDHEADRRYVRRLERICNDEQARRELLWLGAKEKEDAEAVAALERADPRIAARLRRRWALPEERGITDPRRRRRAYAALWSACFAHHMARAAPLEGAATGSCRSGRKPCAAPCS